MSLSTHHSRQILFLFGLVAMVCFGAGERQGAPASPDEPDRAEVTAPRDFLTFGVFPFLTAARLEEGFTPLVAELQKALGMPIRFRSTRDYTAFMSLLEKETWDLAYVQPFDYVRIAGERGYRPLVHRSGLLSAQLVARPGSPIKDLQGLKGKTLGLPPRVAAISYLSKSLLREKRLDSGAGAVGLQHFRTHDSCLQQLLVNNVDACSVGDSALSAFEKQMQVQLKRLGQSPQIPPSLIVGHRRLGEPLLKRIQDILHLMEQKAATRKVLGLTADDLQVAADSEYDPVREIWRRLKQDSTPLKSRDVP